jgi:hypothetical protein
VRLKNPAILTVVIPRAGAASGTARIGEQFEYSAATGEYKSIGETAVFDFWAARPGAIVSYDAGYVGMGPIRCKAEYYIELGLVVPTCANA